MIELDKHCLGRAFSFYPEAAECLLFEWAAQSSFGHARYIESEPLPVPHYMRETVKEGIMPRVSLFVLTAAFLVLISSSLTSQDPKPPGAPPGDATGSHPQAVPPAQESADANRRIHDSISDLLSSDPVVDGADIEVAVDDKNITLTGTVESYAQHQRVLQLVAQYGRWRRIVDHIK